jgi:hypothetical protein
MSLNLFAHSMIQSDCCGRVRGQERETDRERERQTERQRERDRERDREEGGEANLCKMYFTLKTLPYCFANCAFSSLEAITIWPRGDEPAALKVVLELAVL